MKYTSIGNQPNVSRTRFQSVSPSLQLDDRGYPHIAWLDLKTGYEDVKYSFWDGLKWSYYDSPSICMSEESIRTSPNSLVLDSSNLPHLVFIRNSANNDVLSLATYQEDWNFNELNIAYNAMWIGIVKIEGEPSESSFSSSSSGMKSTSSSLDTSSSSEISSLSSLSNSSSSSILTSSSTSLTSLESNSSSSSSSFQDAIYFIVVYDGTDSLFRVYSVTDNNWTFIGSMLQPIDAINNIKIDACGRKIGIVAQYDDSILKYNFFDIDTWTWSFALFNDFDISANYGTFVDMSLDGYSLEGESVISLGWLSRTEQNFYIGSMNLAEDGSQTPTNLGSPIIETSVINVTTTTDYIVNGYRLLDVSIGSNYDPYVFVTGSATKLFHYNRNTLSWSSELIDMQGTADGFVPNYLKTAYSLVSAGINISLATDGGDIYYLECDASEETFPLTTPDLMVLNTGILYHATYQDGALNGVDVEDIHNNTCAGTLKDARRPLLIIPDENSSSSESSILFSESSGSSVSSYSSVSSRSTGSSQSYSTSSSTSATESSVSSVSTLSSASSATSTSSRSSKSSLSSSLSNSSQSTPGP